MPPAAAFITNTESSLLKGIFVADVDVVGVLVVFLLTFVVSALLLFTVALVFEEVSVPAEFVLLPLLQDHNVAAIKHENNGKKCFFILDFNVNNKKFMPHRYSYTIYT
jgi:hypothetical protein